MRTNRREQPKLAKAEKTHNILKTKDCILSIYYKSKRNEQFLLLNSKHRNVKIEKIKLVSKTLTAAKWL